MKKFVLIALICLCFGLNVFAQAKIKVLKYEAPRGSKAVYALGLKGEFIVTVKIDKDGKVISADSGDIRPLLLKQVLEESASKWLFSPDKDSKEREAKIFFEYRTKFDNSKKNSDKSPTITSKFKKPMRFVITGEVHRRTSVY